MASVSVRIDSRAFRAGFAAAIQELKGEVDLIVEHAGETGAERARVLAPKRTHALEESIHVTPLVRGPGGPFVKVVAGTREAIFMEFGTYKDRAQPFMRPAAAMVAGGLRGAAYAARVTSDKRSRLFARRLRARAEVRRQHQRGELTSAQGRLVSRQISQRLRYRRPRRRG